MSEKKTEIRGSEQAKDIKAKERLSKRGRTSKSKKINERGEQAKEAQDWM